MKTNLGLLDNGITWGYVVLLCVVAFASKFFACAGAAFAMGFNWREAGAMGSLMSCKGYVLCYLRLALKLVLTFTSVSSSSSFSTSACKPES